MAEPRTRDSEDPGPAAQPTRRRGALRRRPTRLDRYVFRQLLVSLVAATTALVALIWLTQSLRLVELVVNRGLSLRVFLHLTGLLIPGFVSVILPITTFVVVQFVYQRLAGDRELTVMRAAGLSQLALSRPALGLAGLAAVSCLVLNVWVVPSSYAAFREYQFAIRNRLAAFLLQEGVFTAISDQLTVYVRSRDTNGTLRGILVEDDRQKNTRATILAESGRLVDTGGAPRVQLFRGSREEIDKTTGRLDVLTFAENAIDLSDPKKATEVRYRDTTEMSIGELLHPDPREITNPRDRGKFLVEANRRLSSPLTALGFSLVALCSVLTGGFQRHGNVLRPLIGVATVVGLLALGLAVASIAAREPLLMPLVWLAAGLPIVVCLAGLLMPGLRSRRAMADIAARTLLRPDSSGRAAGRA
ncbi:MAG: LPS export ABC transporter permease LptF [Janthinobacterium lividum]